MNSTTLRIVLGLLAALIIVMIGNNVYRQFNVDYETETALISVGMDSEQVQGVFVRDEQVLTYDGKGVISYEVPDGGKLGIGSVIANVYTSENQIEIKQRIRKLSEELLLLQRISNPGTTQTAQPSNLSDLFVETYKDYLYNREQGDLSNLQKHREEMIVLLGTYELVTGGTVDYNAKIESIQTEITSLTMAQEAPLDSIVANKACYFVSYADGYEDTFTLSNVETLTAEQLLTVQDGAKQDANIVGKLITGYEWALAVVVDNSQKIYEQGDLVTLKFPSTSERVKGEIIHLNESSGAAMTVLTIQCENLTYDLVQHRTEPVELIRGEYKGIKVPRSALRFETLTEEIEDPETGIVTEQTTNYRGVYVLNGERPEFRKLDVIYEGTDYVISAQTTQDGYLLLYDSIITKGIDADGA